MAAKNIIHRKVPVFSGTDGVVTGLTPGFIGVNGRQARYSDMGPGEPLVLRHCGAGGSPNSANIRSKNVPGPVRSFRGVFLAVLNPNIKITAVCGAGRFVCRDQPEMFHRHLTGVIQEWPHRQFTVSSRGNRVAS